MVHRFDIEEFRVTQPLTLTKAKRTRRSFRDKQELFIPGPIPARLLNQFRVPAALRVWLALHTRTRMGLSPRLARDFFAAFGLSKRLAQRGLAELERLGLAIVTRERGRATEVQLQPIPPAAEGDNGDAPRGRA